MAGNKLKMTWKGTPGQAYEGREELAREGAVDGLNAIGMLATSQMKAGIQRGAKTGKTYQKYGPRREHQASAPGEFPASDTGRLAGSIGHDVRPAQLQMEIYAAAKYARPLELKPASRGGRPFMLPTLDRLRQQFGQILAAAIGAKLK